MTDLKPIEYTPPTTKEAEYLTWAKAEGKRRAAEPAETRIARNARWLTKIQGQLREGAE